MPLLSASGSASRARLSHTSWASAWPFLAHVPGAAALRRPEFIARQSACPSGLLGRLIGRIMAKETAAANEAALDLLDLQPNDRVLEVGFGHGATIARAAAAVSRGVVDGVDPSAEMCRMAARLNRASIAAGRVPLHQALVEALPFDNGEFDKVFSVHTVYFWPDLAAALTEIRRVLKPRGRLVLGWRDDPGAARSFPETVYRIPDEATVLRALEGAAFGSLRIVRRRDHSSVLKLAIALSRELTRA